MANDAELLYMYLLAIFVSYLEKCLYKSFAHLLIGLFVFLLSCILKIYSGDKSLVRYMIYKYFLPFSVLSLHFLDGVL